MKRSRPPYSQRIASALGLRPEQVQRTIDLLDEGNTIPFIARYRKEVTFNLDEYLIRQVAETVEKLRTLDERRDSILGSIEEQGQLTEELANAIEAADNLTALEDLYAPYKPKRKTRASIARERGLEPLAQRILAQASTGERPDVAAQAFLTPDVPTVDDALQGARDIVAEIISDDAQVRGALREKALHYATLNSRKKPDAKDEKAVFEVYYQWAGRVSHIKPYQTLAVNRGEHEGVLRVALDVPERDWRDAIGGRYLVRRASPWAEQLQLAIDDSAKRLLLPAIERDVRRHLTEAAEQSAITTFADNLRNLLQQAPLSERIIMGVDPGLRTGCKVAVIDPNSKVLATDTVYLHTGQRQQDEGMATLAALIVKHKVRLIAIGNGTASRETEQLVAKLTAKLPDVQYAIVSEAGASVYSASDLARAELPDLDVSLRGAVSIARRLQDPLAELVKIDPKSIGVGLYQHDVDQKALSGALDGVVESVVNQVGVDVNTASPALLRYVAGIGPKLAQNIVAHREANGRFESRTAIKKVSGMGPKAFEQAAGFLRIRGGKQWLDSSAIHPESYEAAKALMERAGLQAKDAPTVRETRLAPYRTPQALKALAAELGAGELTLADIVEQLARPGRDPREDVPPPLLRSDVMKLEDLREGMTLSGTVRNVVDFGAFVDIGVKQDGLLHVSQMPRGTKLAAGDIIRVIILKIDPDKGRIGLGWKEQ